VGEHLDDSDHGQTLGLDHRPHSGGAQAGSGAPEELRARQARAERFHKLGGVLIARGFAGGNEDPHTHLDQYPTCYNGQEVMSDSVSLTSRLPVEVFAEQFKREAIPINSAYSYFTALPLDDSQFQQFVQEPVAALPPELAEILPPIRLVLVPYLERGNSRSSDLVSFEKPAENRLMVATTLEVGQELFFFLAVKDEDVADYHYTFYNGLSSVTSFRMRENQRERYNRLLREELANEAHGEVEERSWRLKQALRRRQTNLLRDTKLQREYFRQSFEDTFTLYLHGLCCDIDVETGPRQLPTRFLRKRLELLREIFPPPEGFALFPEEIRQ
jgi:hypothetical protein